MSYPSAADYNLAVRYIGKFVSDPVLKTGVPRSRNGVAVEKGGEPLSYPGGFAKVYKVDCGTKTYALRVWLHEVSDAAKRYQATTAFLKQFQLPFFVEHFEFVPNGILAGGKRYPILRMEWIEGYSLGEFIKQNLNQPDLLQAAAGDFGAMAAELHRNSVAHGDLQSENVVLQVSNGAVRFRLIDYDTLVVPALLGQPILSTGLPSYQHPNRAASTTATEKDDYFSELVIYTCFWALSENPQLWAEFPTNGLRDKELLFEADDFTALAPSALFQRLYQMRGKVARLAVVLWNFTRCPNIRLLLPIEKVLELVDPPTAAPTGSIHSKNNGSAFGRLLQRKLNEKQPFKRGLPNTWLDDVSFVTTAREASPKGEIPAGEKPPGFAQSPNAEHAATDQSSPRDSAAAPSFKETMARMTSLPSSTPAKPASTYAMPTIVMICFFAGFLIVLIVVAYRTAPPLLPVSQEREKDVPPVEPASPTPTAPIPTPTPEIRNTRDATPPKEPRKATIRQMPKREFHSLTPRFLTPGPEAEGELHNDTEWFITGATIIVSRHYEQDFGSIAVAPPRDAERRFELTIVGGVIEPHTTSKISAKIGKYLDALRGTVEGNPNQTVSFRVHSKVRFDSVRGYPK
jgi:serine/threonine protein kinase